MSEGLARWHEGWDQTRAESGKAYVFEDDDILIATDFECANGVNPRAEGDGYALDLEPEPGVHRFSGMSYYFCFGVRNKRSEPRTMTITLRNQGIPQWAKQTRHVVTRRGDRWGQLPHERIRGETEDASVTLTLTLPGADEPDPEVFFSNFHWHPYTDLMAWLRDTAEAHPALRLSVIGRSHFGRDLPCATIGLESPDAPQLVMAATPQPSEMGAWSCRAVLAWLLGNSEEAKRARRTHCISVLPATTPDGIVLGMGVSDGQGRLPLFEGELAATHDASAVPEIAAVWQHLERTRPWLYIEWHSNNWSRRPGHMLIRYEHELVQDAVRRRIWDMWEEHLLDLPDTHHASWTGPKRGMYQPTIGYQAATMLNTPALKIKHHDRFLLRDNMAHAVASFRAALHSYEEIMGRPTLQ